MLEAIMSIIDYLCLEVVESDTTSSEVYKPLKAFIAAVLSV